MSELKPCPNPECVTLLVPRFKDMRHKGGLCWLECGSFDCNTGGPTGDTLEEATRLWNLLPRITLAQVAVAMEGLANADAEQLQTQLADAWDDGANHIHYDNPHRKPVTP